MLRLEWPDAVHIVTSVVTAILSLAHIHFLPTRRVLAQRFLGLCPASAYRRRHAPSALMRAISQPEQSRALSPASEPTPRTRARAPFRVHASAKQLLPPRPARPPPCRDLHTLNLPKSASHQQSQEGQADREGGREEEGFHDG